MPCWQEDAEDHAVEVLVTTILNTLDGLTPDTDLREYSKAISESVFAKLQQTKQPSKHEDASVEDDIQAEGKLAEQIPQENHPHQQAYGTEQFSNESKDGALHKGAKIAVV